MITQLCENMGREKFLIAKNKNAIRNYAYYFQCNN